MTNPKNNVRQMPKPPTEEEKKQQVLRFLAQKRESYIQLILANILQNPSVTITDKIMDKIVDTAIEGADYAMERLFPLSGKEGE